MRVTATSAYIYGLSALAVASIAGWIYFFGISTSWVYVGAVAVLVLACAISRHFPLEYGRARVEVADVAMLVAIVLLGPIWALLVAVPAVLYRDPLRTTFVAASDTVKIVAAGYAFHLISTPVLVGSQFDTSVVYGLLLAGVTFYTLDALTNAFLMYLKYKDPLQRTLKDVFLPLLPSNIVAGFAALGISQSVVIFGPAAGLVLFCGVAGALVSLRLVHARQEENEALKAENESLLSANLTFANRLVESLNLKDGYTARHAAASAVYAADTAQEFGLEPATVKKLRVAALLQDVGLCSVPDEVIQTPPEKLNSIGRMHLEEHPVQSERILGSVPEFEKAARWARWHHESVDGTGYPDRLRGEWIPLEAKILAAAGTYASLVLDGMSRAGLSPLGARRKLVELSGRSLDAEVVRTLLRVLDSEDENYASATDCRFALPGPGAQPADITAHLRPTGTGEQL